MRKRNVHAYEILTAVALGAAPACTKPVTNTGVVAAESPSAAPSAAVATSGSPGAGVPSVPRPEDPVLVTLRGELLAVGRAKAMASKAHYRPLCDGQGYPLVGNLAQKAQAPADYQPSDFCSEIRKAGP